MSAGLRTFQSVAEAGLLEFSDGYRTKKDELGDIGFRILRVGEVQDGFIIEPADPEYVREEFRGKIRSKLSQVGDIVVTTKGTVGRRAWVTIESAGCVYSPQVCYFRVLSPDEIDPFYLYFWLGSREFMRQLDAFKAQTDMADYVSLRDMGDVRIFLPTVERQRDLGQFLRAVLTMEQSHRRASHLWAGLGSSMFDLLAALPQDDADAIVSNAMADLEGASMQVVPNQEA